MNVPALQSLETAFPVLAVAGAYALLSFLFLKKILTGRHSRNFLNAFTAFLFISFAILFLFSGLEWERWLHSRFFPLLFAALGLFLAILILYVQKLFGLLDSGRKETAAEPLDKMKEQFLSMASHELRTPLSVINGFAEVLVREKIGPLNDEQKRRLRKVLTQGQRLNRIVDELLDLSKIRSGKIEVRKEIFDLVPVLKACFEDHQVVCEQQQIAFVDQIPDVLPDVVGDLERVTQIVVNLLNNAIKYTEPGGRVWLGASQDTGKNRIRVEVKDTGIGIDPADQLHIFEEFFRAQHPYQSTRKSSGSGLGLAIVKQLVEAQGGTVGLFSEGTGKGSTFFFTLPASRGPEPRIQNKNNSAERPKPLANS